MRNANQYVIVMHLLDNTCIFNIILHLSYIPSKKVLLSKQLLHSVTSYLCFTCILVLID